MVAKKSYLWTYYTIVTELQLQGSYNYRKYLRINCETSPGSFQVFYDGFENLLLKSIFIFVIFLLYLFYISSFICNSRSVSEF